MESSLETPRVLSPSLRLMGIGDVLDRAIYFYRTHFFASLAIVALFAVPLTLLNAIVTWLLQGEILQQGLVDPMIIYTWEYWARQLGAFGFSLLSYPVMPLQVAGIAIGLRAFLLENRRASFGEMLAGIRTHLRPLLLTGLAALALIIPLLLTMIIPPVGAAILTFFSLAFLLAPFIVLYEKRQGMEALRRGWFLLRHNIWRTLGYVALLYLIPTLLGGAIGAVLGMVGQGSALFMDNYAMQFFIQTIVITLTSLLITPFTLAVMGVLYFDLRMRNEGLDVALDAARAAGEPVDLAAAPAADEPVMNGTTWKAIGALSGIYVLLFVVFCACIFALSLVLVSLWGFT